MNTQRFITSSIFRYKSYYRLIALAVIVAVAVIIGSLVVGDSVRSTLIKRVEERLGKTETIIFSRYSYLDDSILETLKLNADDADDTDLRGILLMNGFVSLSGKLIPVMVWGMDDMEIEKGHTKINNALYSELKSSQIKEIVLRLPSAGMVPLGSMYVTDTYTTSLRLELDSIVSVEQGGNINLKNEHTIPFNIFVNREELAEIMEVPGKINVILSGRIISTTDFASTWNYSHSGLNINNDCHCVQNLIQDHPQSPSNQTTILSDRIFIQDKVVETLCKKDSASNRIYSYLANSIHNHVTRHPSLVTSIPYSFITAVDYFDGQALKPDEIILSDYAAGRLNVRLNDTISISYFISRQFKTLTDDSLFLKVSKIVPLKDLQSDKTLAADFPGLSNVERCTDWDSDLPINMKLITDEDEDYWTKYKNTPKAIVPYSTLAPRWENAFGSATALCISDASRLDSLSYEMFDIQVMYPREVAITAAKSGVDFSGLFLSLGFFIIVSAAMLMMVPLSEMLFRRRDELNLLKATGFPNKRILRLLWRESAPVVFVSAIIGIIAGLVYTYLVLFMLGTVWKGATHTEGFRVYPHLITLVTGMFSGIILSLLLLYIRIARTLKKKPVKKFSIFNFQLSTFNYFCSILLVILLIINIFFIQSALLFVCTGIVFLLTGWTWFDYLIKRNTGTTITKPYVHTRQNMQFSPQSSIVNCKSSIVNRQSSIVNCKLSIHKLIWSSLFYTRKQVMLSFITLASGVFIVFSVGLNRQGFADSSQIRTATGGYSLWCETAVPVYHNILTEEGRSKLGLKNLPKETQAMQLLKYSADDASCLNLNKVVAPNVLGIDMEELAASEFKITKTVENSVYPALVDETVLTWSLGKKLGDTIVYMGEKGEKVTIQLAGTISNSIFQGYILIDKSLFSEIWSEISGSEIMLVKAPDEAIDDTKALISQALNNYGVRVMTTGERLQLFYSVTDTYLTIFLTLGGLGLLLGIFSFFIVVRKSIIARLKEINLYRSLGFDDKRMVNLLYKENIIIPLYAISTGALGSLLGVSMGFGNVSFRIWAMVVLFLAVFLISIIAFIKNSVRKFVSKNRR